MPTSLITGANGFIGRALCQYLLHHDYIVHGTVRTPPTRPTQGLPLHITGDIDGNTDWRAALRQVHSIVHLAGVVHRPDIQDSAVYQTGIVAATRNLATQAMAAGVKRFIYVSSSHVYGVTASTIPLVETHPCHPLTLYGQAKWQAEQALQQHMGQPEMEIVIVRPPLVYGPGVRGNFAQLVKWVKMLPCLPLGCATQLRSLVGLDNLVAFLHCCLEHPQAANSVFNISDDHDVSTRVLCEKLAELLHKKRVFLPLPASMMRMCLRLCGKEAMYDKLFASLRLDTRRAHHQLGWQAPFGVDGQLAKVLEGV